jgi:hypothetical protein
MSYCHEKGLFCEFACMSGYCSETGCRKSHNVTYEICTMAPVTNADHIRSMTDEELAKFSAYQMSRRDCWGCTWFWPCDYEKETCTKFFLDWLKQPYGGGT